jgi:hypothetical protein
LDSIPYYTEHDDEDKVRRQKGRKKKRIEE